MPKQITWKANYQEIFLAYLVICRLTDKWNTGVPPVLAGGHPDRCKFCRRDASNPFQPERQCSAFHEFAVAPGDIHVAGGAGRF